MDLLVSGCGCLYRLVFDFEYIYGLAETSFLVMEVIVFLLVAFLILVVMVVAVAAFFVVSLKRRIYAFLGLNGDERKGVDDSDDLLRSPERRESQDRVFDDDEGDYIDFEEVHDDD